MKKMIYKRTEERAPTSTVIYLIKLRNKMHPKFELTLGMQVRNSSNHWIDESVSFTSGVGTFHNFFQNFEKFSRLLSLPAIFSSNITFQMLTLAPSLLAHHTTYQQYIQTIKVTKRWIYWTNKRFYALNLKWKLFSDT